MQTFWLILGFLILTIVTYKGFTDGFERWVGYYLFAGLSFFMYAMRRYMLKRMVKHQEFLKSKTKEHK